MIRFFIIAVILLIGCSSQNDQRLIDFNNELGIDKALVLDKISTSFEDFLLKRYPDKSDYHDRLCDFLVDIAQNDFQPTVDLMIPDSIAFIIISDYQNSGLSNELMIKVTDSAYIAQDVLYETEVISEEELYSNNNPDTLSQTDLYDFNLYGGYHQALTRIKNDDFISRYVEVREDKGDMSLSLIVPTFIDYCDIVDYNDPLIKRIVTLELYIPIVYMSLK